MTPEQLHDALNFLSDDLLEQTDALRQRKRISWKPLAALAACACLVAGLYLFAPSTTSKDSAECAEDKGSSYYSESAFGAYLTGEVLTVQADRIEVRTKDTGHIVTVSLSALEDIPSLAPGQHVRIYSQTEETLAGSSNAELIPYKIEIIDNKED